MREIRKDLAEREGDSTPITDLGSYEISGVAPPAHSAHLGSYCHQGASRLALQVEEVRLIVADFDEHLD
jgi:hypothetical protein